MKKIFYIIAVSFLLQQQVHAFNQLQNEQQQLPVPQPEDTTREDEYR
jgi:hypothetical protein